MEVEYVPNSGTYVDITADVVPNVSIKVGRASIFDDAQPGEMNFSVRNDAGSYTPESALASRAMAKGLRVRYSIVRAATTRWRYIGRIKSAVATSLDFGKSGVAVSCVDGLGYMQTRTLDIDWVEAWRYRSKTEVVDCWPMDDETAATTVRNIGTGAGRITVRAAATGQGSAERGSVAQGLLLPGQITLTPADSGIGPVVAVDLGRALGGGVITFALSISDTTTGADLVLAQALDMAGLPMWSLRLHANAGHTDLVMYDDVAVSYATLISQLDGSDKWLAFSFYDSGSNAVMFINNGEDGGATLSQRCDTLRYLVLGGTVGSWKLLGKQSACPRMVVAGVAAATTSHGDLMDRARPLVTTYATNRFDEFTALYCSLGRTWTGSILPQVTRVNTTGRSALDCLNQLIGTIGGTVWHDYSTDKITTTMPDASRPTTSSATIVLEQDDDDSVPIGWAGPSDTTPTRVTVSSAAGSKTAVNAYAEQVLGLLQPETWDSCAADDIAAGALAGARLNRAVGARIPQVAVDLVHATNDRYAEILSLDPGSRVTLGGLPSALVGVSSADCYVMGWTEVWGQSSAVFTFDLMIADKPAELRLDDALYSRLPAGEDATGVPLMTVTGGTAIGTTANGTLIITTASGPTLSTAAGSYPLDLDWDGELVTITSAPAGSASPQTVTTTTRGKAPTVARVHAAGDPIDVRLPATIAGV